MCSSNRAEANRRNARKSTGPKTAAGKERSRFNALKHGLRARLPVLPGEDAEAYQRRLEGWVEKFRPGDAVELYLVERAVHVSWQLDRADRTEAAWLRKRLRNASHSEHESQAEEVAAVAARLFRAPRGPGSGSPGGDTNRAPRPRGSRPRGAEDRDNPARLVGRLEAIPMGCLWLLDRWAELRKVLDDGGTWQAPERLRAVRLLGKQPVDAADDEVVASVYLGCCALGPAGQDPFGDVASGLSPGEAEVFRERLLGRGFERRMPADAEAGKAMLLAIIAAAVTRLKDRLARYLERNSQAAAERVDRLAFDNNDSAEWLRRHQATCSRTLLRTIEALRKLRRDGGDRPDTEDEAEYADEASSEPAGGTGSHLVLVDPAGEAPVPLHREDEVPSEPLDGMGFQPASDSSAGATNEATSPATADASGPAPEDDGARNATNEATGPAEGPARLVPAVPALVIALLIVLVSACLSAVFAASVEVSGTSRFTPWVQGSGGLPMSSWAWVTQESMSTSSWAGHPGRSHAPSKEDTARSTRWQAARDDESGCAGCSLLAACYLRLAT
jgi:hypothetical protein